MRKKIDGDSLSLTREIGQRNTYARKRSAIYFYILLRKVYFQYVSVCTRARAHTHAYTIYKIYINVLFEFDINILIKNFSYRNIHKYIHIIL